MGKGRSQTPAEGNKFGNEGMVSPGGLKWVQVHFVGNGATESR